MKAVSLFLFLSSFICSAQAFEAAGSLEDTRALSDSVMQSLADNKLREGVLKLKPFNQAPTAEFDVQLNSLELQAPAMGQRFGKAKGYEFIAEDAVGDSLIRHEYILKFERFVTVWRFVYYKSDEGWLLVHWGFNDNVQALF
ncbi:hypothetical protein [Parahalioglobus pacificus]|uniref:DUF4440 domain-containing protein n=1 Tax=Parahalioglobus pacificus TaxID=930806 RepID=A0A918XFH7_9GAMM|nr:hypothetical protein [Halioglobus pacificus]GHD29632.1 hypothetical protein GCM10007053_10490 [Halioglobus pacificus]